MISKNNPGIFRKTADYELAGSDLLQ